ncbi:hypothetical protein ABZP36_007693 [Zizania latifolia]
MDFSQVRWRRVPLLCLVVVLLQASFSACGSTPKTYIVQMAASEMPSSFDFYHEWYASTVKSVSSVPQLEDEEDDPSTRIVYNYETAFHGFSARLNEEEAELMADADGVLAVIPETVLQLHTTRSPDFLGISPEEQYPVVYLGGNSSIPDPRSLCLEGTLPPHDVSGKIVICDRGISPRVQKGQVVKDAGGIGMILANTVANGEELVADSHLLPSVAVGESEGIAAKRYIKTTPKPTATLSFGGTKLGIRPSPVVAAFSSRGPNFLTLEILKPDVVAPGVNVLAAWSGDASPSSLSSDSRRDAATGKSSTPFEHGAGHIHPVRALRPGLVYDIGQDDYLEFLCTQHLTPMQLKTFTKSSSRRCRHTFSSASDLNYPAISVVFADQPSKPLTVRRTVTNVGPPSSTYHVKVTQFKGADVVVEPNVLHFVSLNQKLTYKDTLRTKVAQKTPEFGALSWSDGVHNVRSPVVLAWLPPQ